MATLTSHGRDGVASGARADFRAGLLAGVAAGLVMSFPMMAMTTFMMRMGPWPAAKLAWSLLAGPEVVRPGFELLPVLGGMAVHLALSAGLGLIFAALTRNASGGLVLLGVLFGAGLYLTNIVIVPRLVPGWVGHMAAPDATMHLAEANLHGLFGLVLGLAYRAWRRK